VIFQLLHLQLLFFSFYFNYYILTDSVFFGFSYSFSYISFFSVTVIVTVNLNNTGSQSLCDSARCLYSPSRNGHLSIHSAAASDAASIAAYIERSAVGYFRSRNPPAGHEPRRRRRVTKPV